MTINIIFAKVYEWLYYFKKDENFPFLIVFNQQIPTIINFN